MLPVSAAATRITGRFNSFKIRRVVKNIDEISANVTVAVTIAVSGLVGDTCGETSAHRRKKYRAGRIVVKFNAISGIRRNGSRKIAGCRIETKAGGVNFAFGNRYFGVARNFNAVIDVVFKCAAS